MSMVRVIPSLLLKNGTLVKTIGFKNPHYIGDPINAVRIFNEMEVDELIFLDITATVENRKPKFNIISDIANECFMPFTYGGGINCIEDIKKILGLGVEKIAINSYAIENPSFIQKISDIFGSQSIVVSIDVKKSITGKYEIFTHCGRKETNIDAEKFAIEIEKMGAGELLLNSIDKEGTMEGYDTDLIKIISNAVKIPVIASGGAGDNNHLKQAIRAGASAITAGSMFVYQSANRAVLINYPSQEELQLIFDK